MIIINKSNPKIMRNLILGRGYNKNIFETNQY